MKTVPITYIPGFVAAADGVFDRLWNELDWVRHDKVPRREYYCNALNEPYTYGKEPFARTYQPQIWHPLIIALQDLLKSQFGMPFEVCFVNGYENQSDQLGWHSDNSSEMDDERPIAIISLGVEREIWFREIPEPRITRDVVPHETAKLTLEHGSLCLMHPGMQDTHQHRIPKASFMCGERLSLTFRGYVNEIKTS